MPFDNQLTHYARLGVASNATPKEIKAAYRKRARTCHPDRVPGKIPEFQALQQAYATLISPLSRKNYDRDLAEKGLAPPAVLSYFLEGADIKTDHYTYYNQLFRVEDEEQIHPDVALDKLYVAERLRTVSEALRRKENEMCAQCPYEKMDKEQIKQLTCIVNHREKIVLIKDILCDSMSRYDRYKELYDLSLGVYQSPKLRSIEEQLGGRAELLKAIEHDKKMHFTNGVFALYKANCLTPNNFWKLAQHRTTSLSSITWWLVSMDCLTQANFDLVYRKRDYLYQINEGMGCLQCVNLANQEYFHYIVQAGEHALTVSETIEALKTADILNQETLQMALKRTLKPDIAPLLTVMKKDAELTSFDAEIFIWEGPQKTSGLIQQLNQMFTHGLFLLTRDAEKGKIAMRLALDLKHNLRNFIESPKEDQVANFAEFQQKFKHKLHSKDDIMSEHREYWKVITANILIALSGIGLFAIGANYVVNGHCFFAQTTREKLIDKIEYEAARCGIEPDY